MDHHSLGSLAVWVHPATIKPRARVLIIHGICEHSGRHLSTINHLNAEGFEVVRFDLRGAGKSGGKRQFVKHWEDYVDDTIEVHSWICREKEPLPFFVLGHSMGGAVAAYFAKQYQLHIKGLCLSAPAYLVGGAISPLKIAAGKVLSNLLPTLKIPGGEDRTAISRDEAVLKDYYSDPLNFHFNTVKQGDEVLRGISAMPAVCRELTIPTFIAHGTHDRIIRLQGSLELIQCIGGKNKVLAILPGVFHEPHNDFGKEKYFFELTQWLNSRLAEKA